MKVWVDQPLLRTPISLIIDDSCPVINKAWFWIEQRHQWRMKQAKEEPPSGWERHYDKLAIMPRLIPSEFAREFGEWCASEGIKGKFSFIPYPAGIGRVDQGFPKEFPRDELDRWIDIVQTIIAPNFDITPEMITHTRVMDLKTDRLTDEWEQFEWCDPPINLLTDYIGKALKMLQKAGIRCDGVTSPGGFGGKKEPDYARAVLEACQSVWGIATPFYFLHVWTDRLPEIPLWWVNQEKGEAVGSIIGCTDDWFGATGWDLSDPDLFITESLGGGRLVEVIQSHRPAIMVGHFPCFYANQRVGFQTLKTVKKRLDSLDPSGTRLIWMKTSEIARYQMAKELSQISVDVSDRHQKVNVTIRTNFPSPYFTLGLAGRIRAAVLGEQEVKKVFSLRMFREGTFYVPDASSFLALPLKKGVTQVTILLEQ
ncbi:MAG: hypothetical protein NZ959_01255 [Armatimonadetes bacterium]|nr:hypothetical protein [Armatimonadota bacterium]MDW8122124.1 hypothetical protein [Armatimonadota bacterium]